MKNLKNAILAVVSAIILSINAQAFAEGVGFIDYKKVQDNYAFAQTSAKSPLTALFNLPSCVPTAGMLHHLY